MQYKVSSSGIRSYAVVCAGVMVVVVVGLILLVSFADLGLSGHGIAALLIGAVVTVALAMVLMGLVFLSDRGGRDADVHEAGSGRSPDERHPS